MQALILQWAGPHERPEGQAGSYLRDFGSDLDQDRGGQQETAGDDRVATEGHELHCRKGHMQKIRHAFPGTRDHITKCQKDKNWIF